MRSDHLLRRALPGTFPCLRNGRSADLVCARSIPHPRYNPWMHLVPARAIENQMYVVGVNRIGKENNAEFFGRSMVVEPKGDIVICGTENKEEILIADLDPSKVKESREYMRCLEERREDVYKNNKKKNHP